MKATLKFDNKEDLEDALNGYKYKLAIEELDSQLRAIIKYDQEPSGLDIKYIDDLTYVSIEDLRSFISKVIREYIIEN